MKVLIVGSGAREYAIGWKIKDQREDDVELLFAPGNGGTSLLGRNVNVPETEIASLLKLAQDEHVDYTIVGPEAPLVSGIADAFELAGLEIFAPSKKAAKIEGSKEFCKEILKSKNIPTAKYECFKSPEAAIRFAKDLRDASPEKKVVLKADGLAAGKGVIIASTNREIEDACYAVLEDKKFGDQKLLVEEFLVGFETSLMGFLDGESIRLFNPVRDHKAAYDGNLGPNTGGMGTFTPDLEAQVYEKEIREEIVDPFIEALKINDIDYRGLVFFGLMITTDGPKVLEINVRFGDPETQAALLTLESDLLHLMLATSRRELNECYIKINGKHVVNVVLASGGYPDSYNKGYTISGLNKVKNSTIFIGGVVYENDTFYTDGGRVLSIAGARKNFDLASRDAYKDLNRVKFRFSYNRTDIGPKVKRVYVWKKEEFDIFSKGIISELKENGVDVESCQLYKRYDIEGLDEEELYEIKDTVLREPPVDNIAMDLDAYELQINMTNAIVRQYKAGQFDQREKGLIDAIKSNYPDAEVSAKVSEVIEFKGLKEGDLEKIKSILINPVDQEEGKLLEVPSSIMDNAKSNDDVEIYNGFIKFNRDELYDFYDEHSFAMSIEDLIVVQDYFKSEKRNPSDVEISIIDTYWSDHCRHTTFNTELNEIVFDKANNSRDEKLLKSYEDYLAMREEIGRKKSVSLMDIGTIHQRYMRAKNELNDVEVSDEINACTLIVDADVDDKKEEYLLFFKNETHNHPTEIEPFGGAQTCLGGAIRDPLSGRGYVYQAMRVTGASDPLNDYEIKGKLTQKKIIRDAAKGYSSYGNQIGLATGYVDELFHPGYKAKRMEVGAVIAAAPRANVTRKTPTPNEDIVILLGGRTGRDGVGGATGSSKTQDETSAQKSGAEVQKGHAPTERKIQRLFRNKEITKMIKKCNDFGAGGVSVAIGELADSLDIYLDLVPLKYKGLSPREIAISESQERMAVVINKKDWERFQELSLEENLEATHVADVTDSGRVRMFYKEKAVVDMSREFLNSTGARREQKVVVSSSENIKFFDKDRLEGDDLNCALAKELSSIHHASKKQLISNFDFSVGRSTVLAPLGGKNELTPINAMVSKFPSKTDSTNTVSFMSYGFNPELMEEDQFVGAYMSVLLSVYKLVATGAPLSTIRLSLQEYFETLGVDEKTWAKPFTALLGALKASLITKTPPIGGKDSMSGTFEDISVPPTLISFAVGYGDKKNVVSTELKGGYHLSIIKTNLDRFGFAKDEDILENLEIIQREIEKGNIKTAMVCDNSSVLLSLLKMSFGNDKGFDVKLTSDDIKRINPLNIVVESVEAIEGAISIGKSTDENIVVNGETLDYKLLKNSFVNGLNEVYGTHDDKEADDLYFSEKSNRRMKSKKPVDQVQVVIPVFEGTNSEYDSRLAFEKEGAVVKEVLIRNLTPELLTESIKEFANVIKESQILFIPGGFSMSDEPDGSAKFIANILKQKDVQPAIEYLLSEKGNDGLVLGICNGFQALVKSGLLPYGKFRDLKETDPTLTFNTIGRHISRIITTKPATLNSPWLKYIENRQYNVPISHGEGRFVCSADSYEEFVKRDQIAFKYVINPNGSSYDIESLMDESGKILGKMGHSERVSDDTYINIPDMDIMNLFKAGIEYFK
ncbi:MAG: phosphoribosylformylglycinamidine synthase [Ezakiella sp.]|nr:phosphoribosylformylglycinamidine synthase [Ezakiella sp.]